MPEPPMPITMMLSISEPAAKCFVSMRPAASCAAASCSGNPQTASRKLSESVIAQPLPDCLAPAAGSRLEGGLDTFASGLVGEALVLGVVDRLCFVDQHDRDVVLHPVTPLEPRVVERRFVLEVEQ